MALETTSEMLITLSILWSLLKYKFTCRKTSKISSQTVTILNDLKIGTNSYPGFRWNGVGFLHSSWCNATFWLLEKNDGDNTGYFSCCWDVLHTAKVISAFPNVLSEGTGVHKKLEEDRTRTADLNKPTIPYDIMWKSYKTGGSLLGRRKPLLGN